MTMKTLRGKFGLSIKGQTGVFALESRTDNKTKKTRTDVGRKDDYNMRNSNARKWPGTNNNHEGKIAGKETLSK